MPPADRSQTPPRRLLTIYYKHKPGGLCKRLYEMIESMLGRGWEVHYVAVEPYPIAHERLKPHLLRLPLRRHEGGAFWLAFLAASAVASLGLAVRLRPALIVAFHPAYAAAAWAARLACRAPLVLFARSDSRSLNRILGHAAWLSALDRLIEWAGFRAADRFLFVSETLRADLARRHGLPAGRCDVLTNEVALSPASAEGRREARRRFEAEFAIGQGEFVVATAGTLNRGKNLPLLVDAFRRMKHTPRTLLVLGDGVDLPALSRETAAERDGPARIVWAGWRRDAIEWLAGADLFVLPTLFEGMSNALLEALGLGVPVLASDIPANREVLGPSDVLFPLEAAGELAPMMDRVAAGGAWREALARGQAERAARLRFDWKERVGALLEGFAQSSRSK